jgi:hypothetical protein
MTFPPLKWRLSAGQAEAVDGPLRYRIACSRNGRWRATMDGCPVGPRKGFQSFEEAAWYIGYGGSPPRIPRQRVKEETYLPSTIKEEITGQSLRGSYVAKEERPRGCEGAE